MQTARIIITHTVFYKVKCGEYDDNDDVIVNDVVSTKTVSKNTPESHNFMNVIF